MEETRLLEYVGDGDITCWLEDLNAGEPCIVPNWPDNYPEVLVVYLDADGTLGMPTSRSAMCASMRPERLWFCRIPAEPFFDLTTEL